MKDLIPGAKILDLRLIGPTEKKAPAAMYYILRKYGNVWSSVEDIHRILCPNCGEVLYSTNGNIFGHIFCRVLWNFEKYSFIYRSYWIGCLYQKYECKLVNNYYNK